VRHPPGCVTRQATGALGNLFEQTFLGEEPHQQGDKAGRIRLALASAGGNQTCSWQRRSGSKILQGRRLRKLATQQKRAGLGQTMAEGTPVEKAATAGGHQHRQGPIWEERGFQATTAFAHRFRIQGKANPKQGNFRSSASPAPGGEVGSTSGYVAARARQRRQAVKNPPPGAWRRTLAGDSAWVRGSQQNLDTQNRPAFGSAGPTRIRAIAVLGRHRPDLIQPGRSPLLRVHLPARSDSGNSQASPVLPTSR